MTFVPQPQHERWCVCFSQDGPPGESGNLHAGSPHLSLILGGGGGHYIFKKAIFLSLRCLEMSKLLLRTAHTHIFPCYTRVGGFAPTTVSLCVSARQRPLPVSPCQLNRLTEPEFFLFFFTCLCFIHIKKKVGDKASIDVCLFYLFLYFNIVTVCQKNRQ